MQLGDIFVLVHFNKSDSVFFCHGEGGEPMSALKILFTYPFG